MTRYLCAHPSHRGRPADERTVDLTAQVRLERFLPPRPPSYLAISEHVIDAVRDLRAETSDERRMAIRQILTGTPDPRDHPVVLVSERTTTREAGVYELDDVRSTVPALDGDRLGTSEDLLIIEDEDGDGPTRAGGGPTGSSQVLAPVRSRARIVPQGVFPLEELVGNLAIAGGDAEAIVDAIRHTAPVTLVEPTQAPWRVVVRCPVPEGEPPTDHDVVFEGHGGTQPAVVVGTPVDPWDALMESSIVSDLAPAGESTRLANRLGALLLTELGVVAFVLVGAWASGALGRAARATPEWLGLSLVLATTAVILAAIPLFVTRDPATNPNDTFAVERDYLSRQVLMRWGGGISAALFGVALVVGIAPPLFERPVHVPAASVEFEQPATQPVGTATADVVPTVLAHVSVTVPEVGPRDTIAMQVVGYTIDERGVMLGTVIQSGDASGSASIEETVAVDRRLRYMTVQVLVDGVDDEGSCTPQDPTAPGCTVLSVP